MLDYVIRNGLVVDGTGAPGRRADVGIRDGKIVTVGQVDEAGATELDAEGLVVAPGIIDPHTHYDAQLFWDPTASPSNLHGVTTVIGGNCGFTLAPIKAEDHDYIRRMMAKVEGMPLPALENGLALGLDQLRRLPGQAGGEPRGERRLPRRALRPATLGDGGRPGRRGGLRRGGGRDDPAAGRVPRGRRPGLLVLAVAHPLRRRRQARSRPATPTGTRCWPSARWCGTTRAPHSSTSPTAASTPSRDEEIDLMVAMTTTARRPLNWNLLTVDSRTPDKTSRQLEASAAAAEAGGRIVALTMPTLVPMNMSFRTHCALFLIPGWGDVMGLPVEQRIEQLRDPAVRQQLDELAHSEEAGVFRRLSHWANYIIGDTFAPENEGLSWRDVGSIAEEQGKRALRRPARPGHRRRAADRAVAQGLRRRRRLVAGPGGRVERPRGHGRVAPTPARTSTGCADPTTRPRSSATACASGSWCPWSGPSS